MDIFRKTAAMAFSIHETIESTLSSCRARPQKKCHARSDTKSLAGLDEIGWSPESGSVGDRRTSTSSTSSTESGSISDRRSSISSTDSGNSLFSYVNMNMSEDALQELAQQELQAEKFRSMIARRRSSSACEERILKHYEKCLADTEARIVTLRLSLGVVASSASGMVEV